MWCRVLLTRTSTCTSIRQSCHLLIVYALTLNDVITSLFLPLTLSRVMHNCARHDASHFSCHAYTLELCDRKVLMLAKEWNLHEMPMPVIIIFLVVLLVVVECKIKHVKSTTRACGLHRRLCTSYGWMHRNKWQFHLIVVCLHWISLALFFCVHFRWE